MQRITPFIWFDDEAEAAAQYYVRIFKNAKINHVTRYSKASEKVAGRPAGSVMTVSFSLMGLEFVALNGGPIFKLNEAVSFVINCKTQAEVNYYWKKLTAGGKASRCGWLKDRFGVSWQVVPEGLGRLLSAKDPAKSQRVMQALLKMGRLDLNKLKAAARGN